MTIQIITPQQLYEFAWKEIKGMHFYFTTTSHELRKYMPTDMRDQKWTTQFSVI